MIRTYSDLQTAPDRAGTNKLKMFVVPVLQLSADHISAWSALQQSDPWLASPFLRPEFTQIMAAIRSDVEVAVWEQGGEPVGFLPFERFKRRVGRPVGSHINEFQVAIARSGVPCALGRRACRRSARLEVRSFDGISNRLWRISTRFGRVTLHRPVEGL